jgi:hypothetical protein
MDVKKNKETLLVVHGSYLQEEANIKEKNLKRKIYFTKSVVEQIVQFIQTRTGVFIDEKVCISA